MYLKIVQPAVEQATVEALRKLQQQAEQGAIVGLVYVALYRGGDYQGDAVGRARRFPLYCLGLIRALEQILVKLIA